MNAARNRKSGVTLPSANRNLEIGKQLFHNGVPVQLLYQVNRGRHFETWRVRPLFVEAPDRDEQFCRSDAISFLAVLLEFLQSTYDAAANLANWDRRALEWDQDPLRAAWSNRAR